MVADGHVGLRYASPTGTSLRWEEARWQARGFVIDHLYGIFSLSYSLPQPFAALPRTSVLPPTMAQDAPADRNMSMTVDAKLPLFIESDWGPQ